MAQKADLLKDVDSASMECMKIRFRLAMGEQIKSSEVKKAKRKVSDAVRAVNSVKRGDNA